MSTEPAPATPTNMTGVVALVLGALTLVAVLLRPSWLITDALGVAAVVVGFVALSTANATGRGRPVAIAAVVLGFTPLVPLLLVLSADIDYY